MVETESGADVEISGDGALNYAYYSVANPARLIIDFRNVQSHLNCDPIQNPYLSAIRCYDLWRSGTVENAVRVVLEFKAHMRFTMTSRTDGLTLHLTAVQQAASVQTPPAETTEPIDDTVRQRQPVQNKPSAAEKRNEEQRRSEQAAAQKRIDEEKRAEQANKTTEQAKSSSSQQQPRTSGTQGTQEPTVPAEPLKKEIPPSKVNSTPKGKVLLPNGKVDLEPADADPALFFAVPTNTSDYVLGPEDVIELKVQQLEELNVTVRIGGDGAVTLPFLNSVQLAGLTGVEAADKIAKLLGEKYLQNPQVSVFAKEFNSQKVSVIGAVTTPGTYPLTGPRTIIQMLAQAGGMRTDAGTNILIFRQDSSGRSTRLSIQRENLLVLGDPAWNILLRAGDVVNIPPQIQISVSLFGAVTTPGVYTLAAGSESTLLKAIARAGGLQRASKSGVKIKRKGTTGKEEIITINLGDILSGKKPDVPLEDGDLIIINESFF
ncbi:MAG TPA: polysaccharide biosynthesis/export family protein [Acidobacteriota bacterium]|nr:polysaccharide biosynthesis/export family protein [Acidobacteriota bacterium]